MKTLKISFLTGLLMCLLFVGSISATPFADTYTDVWSDSTAHAVDITSPIATFTKIALQQYTTPAKYKGLFFITYEGSDAYIPGCTENTDYYFKVTQAGGNIIFDGYATYDRDYNILGAVTKGYFWMHISNVYTNNCTAYNTNLIYFYNSNGDVLGSSIVAGSTDPHNGDNPDLGSVVLMNMGGQWCTKGFTAYYNYDWETTVTGEYTDTFSNIAVERNGYLSEFNLYDLDGNELRSDYSANDFEKYEFFKSSFRYELINEMGTTFEKTLEAKAETINVLTSVFSTTDNSLIAGANVTYYPLDTADADPISKILTYGVDSFSLTPGEHYNYTVEAEYYRSLITQPIYWGMVMGDTTNPIYMSPISENASVGFGTLNFYVKTYSDTSGDFYEPLAGALIQIGNKTLITNDAGYAQTEVLKTAPVSYTVTKSNYISVSRIFTPSWDTDIHDEYVRLRAVDLILDDEPTAQPTLDNRDTIAKAESAFEIVFENIELFAQMGVIVLFMAFVSWMIPKKR